MKNLVLLLPWFLVTSTLAHQQHSVRRPFSHHARALEIKSSGLANGTTTGTVARPAANANGTDAVHSNTTASKNGTSSTAKTSGDGTSILDNATALSTTTTSSTASSTVPAASP